MHWSSEAIGTIAAALAKAQAELVNAEKSLVGTFDRTKPTRLSDRFATRRSRVGWISSARP